ncbi:hypothetical protein G6F68_015768 [Rhizopus microsporus]|nr:hypothetical protein G6F68_015768 [Rhizopus microsporus]
MRIVLVTDAWHPQVNGVVRTWTTMQQILSEWGHELIVVNPQGSRTVPAPSEPDLRLCLQPGRQLRRILGDTIPDALHIATEGPLGLAARRMALARGWQFTTSFHTMFPDYLQARMGIPAAWPWRYLRAGWRTCGSGRAAWTRANSSRPTARRSRTCRGRST